MEGAIPLAGTMQVNADRAYMEESEDQPECLTRDELRTRIHNLDIQRQVRFQSRHPRKKS